MLQAVRVLFRGHSTINAANWVGVVHWMRRWWVLYLVISLILCLHVSTVFLDILSFGLMWPTWRLSRNACSSSNRPLRSLFLGSHLCIGLGLMWGWTFPPPQTGPRGSILYLDLTPPHTHTYIFVFVANFQTWKMLLNF